MRQNRSTSEGVLITTVFLVFFSYTKLTKVLYRGKKLISSYNHLQMCWNRYTKCTTFSQTPTPLTLYSIWFPRTE